MAKGSKSGCKSASHQLFKNKARDRVDDLQGVFTDLQLARKESRTGDVAVLEEQMNQILREWKVELNEPSPASSLLGGSLDSFSDIHRLLQCSNEEDDATSALAPPATLKSEPHVQSIQAVGDTAVFHEDYFVNEALQEHEFQGDDRCKGSPSRVQHELMINLEVANQLGYHQVDLHQNFDHNLFNGFNCTGQCGENAMRDSSGSLPSICPSPSAFFGPKCGLWDCLRSAQGLEWCQDYCSSFHAALALNEGPIGVTPVMQPGGIGLKDGLLFTALSAKTQRKNVGIPECEGVATTKSPWKACDLFNLSLFEGETIREWLFFDKPRRAFESGNRKQRSLPDYRGRGWHESRKQVMKEFGGLKRSYYMDPQPLNHFEWHLYEYEINNCDACALYRLELKLIDGKKSPKGKVTNDSLADPRKQMGRLTAEFPVTVDNKCSIDGRTKFNLKDDAGNVYSASNQMAPTNDSFGYGDYLVNEAPQEHKFQGIDLCNGLHSEVQHTLMNNLEVASQINYHPFDLHQNFDHNLFNGLNGAGHCGEDAIYHYSGLLPSISLRPSAILGPKCALWDCSRLAQESEWCLDYCDSFHADLALNEGQLSMTPVLRPGGIGLKDGPLFSALNAKSQGKDVGIPECRGAATTKSPWNAPELFNLSVLEGESIREWLFFDKPRRAFESGSRKQRSLPDYSGRGWHESRKQLMKEFGGLKRSYYMDPQPFNRFELHLYEYEINNCDACALYRLELKLIDGKKSPKGKVNNDPLADLQKQMGRLTAEFPVPVDNKRSVKGRQRLI